MARPKARIDTAALADAFSADGLHGTSSATLAAATGVAKPTLYAHGESKEALFLRAVEAEVERVLDRLHAAEAATVGLTARARAAAASRALLEHAATRPAGARLVTRTAAHGSSSVAAGVAAATARIADRVEVGLRRDLEADGLDPSLAPFLARALLGASWALGEVRNGERRPARGSLASLAASVVPDPPPAGEEWPAP